MKKLTALLCALILSLTLIGVVGCSANGSGKKSIVCTIFPQYDWIREILGDNADAFDLVLLTDSGVDLHNFEPTLAQSAQIASSDLFVYIGGESDGWVEDVLAKSKNPDMQTLCMIEAVEALEEEIKEGMQDDHDHDHDHDDDHDHEEETEYDEHVWLSLRNAQLLVTELAEKIVALDEENAELYRGNAQAYNEKLAALDVEYTQTVAESTFDTIVVVDRFPFLYLVKDYGIEYYAAFSGCSASTEISVSTIALLADKINELGVGYILVTESCDQTAANAVIRNTAAKNQQILALDSCQTVNKSKIRDGYTYLQAMTDNLAVLNTALN